MHFTDSTHHLNTQTHTERERERERSVLKSFGGI